MEGMNAMGHPISTERKRAAYDTAKEIGIDLPDREEMISSMVKHLEADQPFDAQEVALKYVDITAAYRIIAVLLTTPSPKVLTDAEKRERLKTIREQQANKI